MARCQLLVIALALLVLGASAAEYAAAAAAARKAHSSSPLPVVDIDLDGAPEDRWAPAVKAVLASYTWDQSWGAVFSQFNSSLWKTLPADVYSTCAAALNEHWPEYAAETRGIQKAFAAAGHADVTFEYLAAWVWFHEFLHMVVGSNAAAAPGVPTAADSQQQLGRECTAVLAADASGKVYHGRNMDQLCYQGRNLALHLRFKSANATRFPSVLKRRTQVGQSVEVFRAIDWYWWNTGYVTSFRDNVGGNGVSLQENFRIVDVDLTEMLKQIANGVMSQDWFFRYVMEHEVELPNFKSIVNYLQSQPVAAPMYNIVAGAGAMEGAIITRDVHKSLAVLFLGNTTTATTTAADSATAGHRGGAGRQQHRMLRGGMKMAAPAPAAAAGAGDDDDDVRRGRGTHHGRVHGGDRGSGSNNNGTGAAWYLVETNYDHWDADPKEDARRTAAEKHLAQLGQAALGMSMVDTVMQTSPVLNSGTLYTAIMCPRDGTVTAVRQSG